MNNAEINHNLEKHLAVMKESTKAIGKMFGLNLEDRAIYDRTNVEWMYNGGELYLDVYEDLHGYDSNEIVSVQFVLNSGDYALVYATEDINGYRNGKSEYMKYYLLKKDGEVKL